MYHSRRTVLLADSAADALVLIYLGIASLVDTDSILRTYLNANPACYAAVLLISRFIFSHVVGRKYLRYKSFMDTVFFQNIF